MIKDSIKKLLFLYFNYDFLNFKNNIKLKDYVENNKTLSREQKDKKSESQIRTLLENQPEYKILIVTEDDTILPISMYSLVYLFKHIDVYTKNPRVKEVVSDCSCKLNKFSSINLVDTKSCDYDLVIHKPFIMTFWGIKKISKNHESSFSFDILDSKENKINKYSITHEKSTSYKDCGTVGIIL